MHVACREPCNPSADGPRVANRPPLLPAHLALDRDVLRFRKAVFVEGPSFEATDNMLRRIGAPLFHRSPRDDVVLSVKFV